MPGSCVSLQMRWQLQHADPTRIPLPDVIPITMHRGFLESTIQRLIPRITYHGFDTNTLLKTRFLNLRSRLQGRNWGKHGVHESILDEIVASKRREVAAARRRMPLEELEAQAAEAPPVRDFREALAGPGPIRLIAEVKKASPSAKIIRADFDPVAIARTYQEHGASCISVLTDAPYFLGHLSYLARVRASVVIPLLRKDFLIDEYQVVEARLAGADAVLLIAEILDDAALAALLARARSLGMTALVELHDAENLPRVLAAGADLVGINNRDLRVFKT